MNGAMIFFKPLIKGIKNFFIPPFCQYCRKLTPEETIFCDHCMEMIYPIVSTTLRINKTQALPVFALSLYQEPIKSLIIAKSGSRRLASKQLGDLIAERTIICSQTFDYIVPIPLHWVRYAYRGYNQAEIIAQQISYKTNKPIVNALKRVSMRPFQSKVALEKRYENIKGVFELDKYALNVKGKHILLVDDLMTTGSTLKEAATVLNKLEPYSIKAVVGARIR